MGTIHLDIAANLAEKLLATEDGRRAIALAEEWRRNPVNEIACDVYGQPFSGWSIDQVAALAKMLALVGQGKVRLAYISVGNTPYRDSAREENRAALANLPYGITVQVYEGLSHTGDGCITIPDDLVIVDDADRHLPGRRERAAEAVGTVPLEIGHTHVSRTLLHLADYGAVARWAYGHDRIYVVYTVPMHCLRMEWAERLARRHANLRQEKAT